MNITKYHNTETPRLIKELSKLTEGNATSIKAASEILLELKTRGETHPLMRQGVFRFYQEIADDRLSAKAVLAFAGVNSILRNLIGVPLPRQEAFAKGERIVIATHDTTGKIKSQEKPLIQLSVRQLDLVFDAGNIRSFSDQSQILSARKDNTPARRSRIPVAIRADKSRQELVCGQLRFTPHELASALQKLGFKIIRIEAAKNDKQ